MLPWTLVPPVVEPIGVAAKVDADGVTTSLVLTASARDVRGRGLQYLWTIQPAADGSARGTLTSVTGSSVTWIPPSLPKGTALRVPLELQVSNGQLIKLRSAQIVLDADGRAALEDGGARELNPPPWLQR